MPTRLFMIVIVISATMALVAGRFNQPSVPNTVEVTLTNWGCDATQYVILSESAPELLVSNQADTEMVFAVTDFDQLVRVAPGEHVTMPLQAFVWGTFNTVCMTAAAHDEATGNRGPNPYFCGLDAFALRPRALTTGTLVIEPHSRLQ